MKHRATGVFIIIVAALAVAPRASQQLVALKDAVGSRIEATLWDAFLSLNGQHAEAADGRPFTPVQQAAPSAAEVAGRDKNAAEPSAKPRETSRPETRRAGERQSAGAPEQLIAKLEDVESLFSFDAESVGAARFAVPKELPFELDRLIESAAYKRARGAEVAARVRGAEADARKMKFYALPPEAVSHLQAALRRAPRSRAAKDAKRPVVVKNEWERKGEEFDFDLFESGKPAPPHAAESHSRN